jgi:TonB family protein
VIWARGCFMVGLCAFGGIVASDEPPKDGGCGWSEAWHELTARFTKFPPGAKLTDSKHTKGAIHRPYSAVPRTIQGTWLVEAVIDEKGKVRDAKIVTTPLIEPPWPEYEEAVLKSIRKWKYTPVLVDGEPWPNCTTITIRDK